MKPIKNFMVVVLTTLAILWATNTQGQTTTVYFSISSSELNAESIETLSGIPTNAVIDSIVGFANTLPNLNGMGNSELAAMRAQTVLSHLQEDCTTPTHVVGTSDRDRKVIVYWSNGGTTQSISNVSAGNYSVTVTDVNGCTDTTSISLTQPAVLAATTSGDSVGCDYLDTLSLTEYEMACLEANLDTTPAFCGCGVNNSLEATWGLYKELQDSSKYYQHRRDHRRADAFETQATRTRVCWESMLNQYKHQQRGADALPKPKEAPKAKGASKSKQHRLPRRPVRLNDNVWSRIFPFRNC